MWHAGLFHYFPIWRLILKINVDQLTPYNLPEAQVPQLEIVLSHPEYVSSFRFRKLPLQYCTTFWFWCCLEYIKESTSTTSEVILIILILMSSSLILRHLLVCLGKKWQRFKFTRPTNCYCIKWVLSSKYQVPKVPNQIRKVPGSIHKSTKSANLCRSSPCGYVGFLLVLEFRLAVQRHN